MIRDLEAVAECQLPTKRTQDNLDVLTRSKRQFSLKHDRTPSWSSQYEKRNVPQYA